MFFDILDGTYAEGTDFLNKFKACEMNARVQPTYSVMSARVGIEAFATYLLDHSAKVDRSDIADREGKIWKNIETAKHKGIITEIQAGELHKVRQAANDAIHVDEHGNIKKIPDVKTAVEVFRQVYTAVVSCIVGRVTGILSPLQQKGYTLEEVMPIGKYEVIEPMYMAGNPRKLIPTYRCKRVHKSGNNEYTEYTIIRRFDSGNSEDVRQIREIDAMLKLNLEFDKNHPPIKAGEIYTEESCEYRYLRYLEIKENTLILYDKEVFRTLDLRPEKKLAVFYDIVRRLAEVSDIGGVGLHHRALNPDCIFITPSDGGYKVQIGNFECSKLVDSSAQEDEEAATVMNNEYLKKLKNNVYMPPEIKVGDSAALRHIDWEQVDIYSCAVLYLYLLKGETPVNPLTSLERLKSKMPEPLFDITYSILSGPNGSRPRLNDYLKVIRKELSSDAAE